MVYDTFILEITIKEEFIMILLSVLGITLLAVLGMILLTVFTGGTAIAVLFGDVIVFVIAIVVIVKLANRLRGK